MIFNMAGGGGKLKSANGTQSADSTNYTLNVTGVGFRPYAVVGVSITNQADYGNARGFVCDADGNIAKQTAANVSATVSDDGFTMKFPTTTLMPYHWWAIGK